MILSPYNSTVDLIMILSIQAGLLESRQSKHRLRRSPYSWHARVFAHFQAWVWAFRCPMLPLLVLNQLVDPSLTLNLPYQHTPFFLSECCMAPCHTTIPDHAQVMFLAFLCLLLDVSTGEDSRRARMMHFAAHMLR